MDSLEALKQFNLKLLNSLPMKDPVFLAGLNEKDLFSGDHKAKVKAKPTAIEAADYFLDNVIERDLINGNNDSFLKLFSVMEEYNEPLKMLATGIKRKLKKIEIQPTVSSHKQLKFVTGKQILCN